MVKFLLKYLNVFPVEVSVDSDDPNQPARIEYSGDKWDIYFVSQWLESQGGIFGHQIGKGTTPIDLYSALSSAEAKEKFHPELINRGAGHNR